MIVLGLDPGPEETGVAFYDSDADHPFQFDVCDNQTVLDRYLYSYEFYADCMAFEGFRDYGTAVGETTWFACLAMGGFLEAWKKEKKRPAFVVYNQEVRAHFTGRVRGIKDADLKRAIRGRWGEPGTKKNPGVLYTIKGKSHAYNALGVAVTFIEGGSRNQNVFEKTYAKDLEPLF